MLDTAPVTTAITRMISTGTTGQALLAAVAHLFPNLNQPSYSQALQVATGRGGAARGEALTDGTQNSAGVTCNGPSFAPYVDAVEPKSPADWCEPERGYFVDARFIIRPPRGERPVRRAAHHRCRRRSIGSSRCGVDLRRSGTLPPIGVFSHAGANVGS
jgi:hypothetical protein